MSDMIQEYQNRIISEIQLGNYDAAISNCNKILRTDELNWRAKFYLGFCKACKKKSAENSDDVKEMNRHIDKTLKEISRIGFMEQELAYREISKQLIEYATSCENELLKLSERNNGEYAPVHLRRRAHRVYGMILSMEKILSNHVNATSALLILSDAASEFKDAYPLLSDLEEEDEKKEPLVSKKAVSNPVNSSCFLTVILAIILFLVAIYTLKSLYNFLFVHHMQQTAVEAYEEQRKEENEEEKKEEATEEADKKDSDQKSSEETSNSETDSFKTKGEGSLPIFYYESDLPVISGNTVYLLGSPFEQLMDECKNSDLNPTIKVFEDLVKKRIPIKTCSIDIGKMDDIGMKVQFTDGSDEKNTVDYYDFSEKGSQDLLKRILIHMNNSKLFDTYSVEEIYSDVLDDMPEFTYSPEKIPCYYTFFQIRFKGMTYLWQIYTSSNDGYYISKISAEMMGVRYIKGGSAGSTLQFDKLDMQSFANQMLFMEAAEHELTGKHEIQNCLDFSKSTVSDNTSHEFSSEYGDWKESIRFYESGDMGAAYEEWRDNYISKAELCLEKK